MSFSPEWLALREPADVAARNPAVLDACAAHFAGRDSLTVCDIGAGTGASVRALAHRLPALQDWTLVDHDAGNLAAAKAALSAWADAGQEIAGVLHLLKSGRRLVVRTRAQDLAAEPACWPARCDLVTASALFDLTSAAWMERFVAALAESGAALLAMLTVDGVLRAQPAHPLDEAVFAAFHRHMEGDKGFGPAAGMEAPEVLAAALRRAGYRVTEGDSPWQVGPGPLQDELLRGTAGAAGETGLVGAAELDAWLAFRSSQTRRFTVGHRDQFAVRGQ
jgi:hypothetical protein